MAEVLQKASHSSETQAAAASNARPDAGDSALKAVRLVGEKKSRTSPAQSKDMALQGCVPQRETFDNMWKVYKQLQSSQSQTGRFCS